MCEAFQVEDLALMIRATRGRSMNEGVLIRYLGKWMTFKSSLGLGFRGRLR